MNIGDWYLEPNEKGGFIMCKRSERYYNWRRSFMEFSSLYGLRCEVNERYAPHQLTIVFLKDDRREVYIVCPSVYSINDEAVENIKHDLITRWNLRPVNNPNASPAAHDKTSIPLIRNVYFNNPVTVVMWADGTKTIVRCTNEEYDPEKGLAMCISKKALGNKGKYFETFKYWLKRNEEEKDD